MRTLNGEVNILTTQVEKLGGTTRWAKKLAKVNSILTEFKDSQPFFNLLGSQYGEGFEDFCKQAIILFPGVDFSFVQIDITIPMTPRRDDEVVDIEDGEDEEVFGGKALTPRVTQGDGLPQLEGLTEDKTNLAPTT